MDAPPPDLSGGSIRFDPTSLVLHSDDSLLEIICTIGGILPDRHVSEAKKDAVISRLIHEGDHLIRHTSSSYGFVRHGLHSLMIRHFFNMTSVTSPSSLSMNGLFGPDIRKLLLNLDQRPELYEKMVNDERLINFVLYAEALECCHAMDEPPHVWRTLS